MNQSEGNKSIANGSPGRIAWRKLRKDRFGMVALTIILLTVAIAILGYLISPDQTPYANRQLLEIGTAKPGFSVKQLKIATAVRIPKPSLFKLMLFGAQDSYHYIPFSELHFQADSVVIQLFNPDPEEEIQFSAYLLTDLLFPGFRGNISRNDDSICLSEPETGNQCFSLAALRNLVAENHVVIRQYKLGTDQYGRDLLSRLIIGTRVSLSVGFIAVLISILIGLTVGSLGGYFRGKIDQVVVWLINVVWSIPTLLLVIAITFALGKGFWQVFIAVGMTMWVEVARVVRGQMLSLREKEFSEAAKALGFDHFRIIVRHLLPNVMSPVIIVSAANFASAILIEAGLSFLGLGVQPPVPSWGSMIKENYAFIILDAAYLALLPGLAIMLIVLAFMLLGNSLRDALDVKS